MRYETEPKIRETDKVGVRATHETKGASGLHDTEKLQLQTLREALPQQVNVIGILGKTGIVVTSEKGEVIGAVRGPQTISQHHADQGEYIHVTFGGEQTAKHIEKSTLRKFGTEKAAEIAKNLTEAAKGSIHLPYFASRRGSEIESYRVRVNHADGKASIVKAPYENQEELVRGMEEAALDPADTIEEGMIDRAKHVIQSSGDPDEFLLNTAVPIVGTANDEGLKMNNGKYKEYVGEVASKLKTRMGRFDEYGGQVADFVAEKMGYRNLETMVKEEPTMAYWFNAAGHHSVSLPHIKQDQEGYIVPTEIAIAAADVAASDMGKIAELLMYSSPLILGEAPSINTPEGPKKPLDYRDLYRHLMGTTFPGDLIRDPQTLYDRMKKGIIDEETHTLDRSAFRTTMPDGQVFSSCHGPVRLRHVAPRNGEPISRIETTGPGSSFSLLDEYARDVLLDVFNLAAFEAVANRSHPADYFKDKYPTLTISSNRMDIGRGYNLNGPSDLIAGKAIEECLTFLNEMADKYPPFAKNISIAQNRIANLRQEATAVNFDEYAQDPVGPVSQVIQIMHHRGYTPAKIAQDVANYELKMAKALIATHGDAEPLIHGLK
ncbi:MAG TPA: hypothetical protein VE090_03135 [Methylomirabilota bacterium]|nr:hypothetical protein [Methylomirabilota bacterium]